MVKSRHLGIRQFLFLMGVILLLGPGCAALYWGDDPWTGPDKAYHFAAGGLIGAGTTLAAKQNGSDKSVAPIIGIGTTIAVGGGKEWYDANVKLTYWSWKDMIWDLVGGMTGSYIALQSHK